MEVLVWLIILVFFASILGAGRGYRTNNSTHYKSSTLKNSNEIPGNPHKSTRNCPGIIQKFKEHSARYIHGRHTWTCRLCRARIDEPSQAHVDHILPISKYPEKECDGDNLQILCATCNLRKGSKDGIASIKDISKGNEKVLIASRIKSATVTKKAYPVPTFDTKGRLYEYDNSSVSGKSNITSSLKRLCGSNIVCEVEYANKNGEISKRKICPLEVKDRSTSGSGSFIVAFCYLRNEERVFWTTRVKRLTYYK